MENRNAVVVGSRTDPRVMRPYLANSMVGIVRDA